jgi:hypothetical protein
VRVLASLPEGIAMKTVQFMATPLPSSDTPSFSRLTSGRRASSWTVAVPATFLAVALVVLMAWLAARASSRQQQVANLQRDFAGTQQTLTALQKQATQLQQDLETAKDPGRTTVVLTAPAAAKGKKGAAAAPSSAWGAAVWGESSGKSWIRLAVYGLAVPPRGQALKVWFEPLTGAPILVGYLDPSPTGTGLVEGKGLPEVDQGKRLYVALDAEDAKAPTQASKVLFEASLPKLTPATQAAPTAPAAGAATDKTAPAANVPAASDKPGVPKAEVQDVPSSAASGSETSRPAEKPAQ